MELSRHSKPLNTRKDSDIYANDTNLSYISKVTITITW